MLVDSKFLYALHFTPTPSEESKGKGAVSTADFFCFGTKGLPGEREYDGYQGIIVLRCAVVC